MAESKVANKWMDLEPWGKGEMLLKASSNEVGDGVFVNLEFVGDLLSGEPLNERELGGLIGRRVMAAIKEVVENGGK